MYPESHTVVHDFLVVSRPLPLLDHWRGCEGIAAVQQLYQLWSGCVCDAIVLHISPIAVLRGRSLGLAPTVHPIHSSMALPLATVLYRLGKCDELNIWRFAPPKVFIGFKFGDGDSGLYLPRLLILADGSFHFTPQLADSMSRLGMTVEGVLQVALWMDQNNVQTHVAFSRHVSMMVRR